MRNLEKDYRIVIGDLLYRIRRKWMKLRLQPIRVFCLHHVCATFDMDSMHSGDWMQIDEFKHKVLAIQQNGVKLISLTYAYKCICKDRIRCKKCAVLTFDDGYASLKEILPWLEEQNIPATIFINGKYLDGKSYRKNPKEKYLTQEELIQLSSSMIEIGSHGWAHMRATEQTENEFMESIEKNVALLSKHPQYVPFHAYTYGSHGGSYDAILKKQNIVPVLIDGMGNYNDAKCIHREFLK